MFDQCWEDVFVFIVYMAMVGALGLADVWMLICGHVGLLANLRPCLSHRSCTSSSASGHGLSIGVAWLFAVSSFSSSTVPGGMVPTNEWGWSYMQVRLGMLGFAVAAVAGHPLRQVNSYTSDHRWYLGMVFCARSLVNVCGVVCPLLNRTT